MNVSFCAVASSNSVTLSYWKITDGDAILGSIQASFLLLFIALGLPWNVLVLLTIIKKKLYRQPSITLLMNLVLADILILLYPMPILATTGLKSEYVVGNSDKVRCQTCSYGYVVFTFLYSSLFTVALMSVDRFFYIYKPLQYDRKVTTKVILIPILIAWLVSIAIGAGTQVFSRDSIFRPAFLSCTRENGIGYAMLLLVIGVSTLVVIVVCNVWILCIVLKQIKIIYITRRSITKENMNQQQQINKGIQKLRQKKQLNLLRTFGSLILSNAITWIPFISLVITLIITNYQGVPSAVIELSLTLFYSQCLIHPFVQTLFIADVREPLKQLLTCGVFSKKHSSKRQKTNTCISRDRVSCNKCFFWTAISKTVVIQDGMTDITQVEQIASSPQNINIIISLP